MCGKTLAKIFLVVFNIIFFLLGAALLGIGIFIIVDKGSVIMKVFSQVPSNDVFSAADLEKAIGGSSVLQQASYILIACGAFLFIVGGAGCCGALCEKKFLLYIYAIIVGFLLVIEITAVILGYLYRNDIVKYSENYLNSIIELKYSGSTIDSSGNIAPVANADVFSYAWDLAMVQFECCGVLGYDDFAANATLWNRTYTYSSGGVSFTGQLAVPVTCCKFVNKGIVFTDPANTQFVDLNSCVTSAASNGTNTGGCFTKLIDTFTSYAYYIGGFGIGVVLLEIIGIVSACMLIRANNKVHSV